MELNGRQQAAIDSLLKRVRDALKDGVSRERLGGVQRILEELASDAELFPASTFPSPGPENSRRSTRYLLREDPTDGFSLYVNALAPGKTTTPHTHGTWAVVAGIEGEEVNRLYQRTDDGSAADRATLRLIDEVPIRSGDSIAFLPDDIHSIHVTNGKDARHFHLYGQPLETLTERVGFDLETGAVKKYNSNYMSPTQR